MVQRVYLRGKNNDKTYKHRDPCTNRIRVLFRFKVVVRVIHVNHYIYIYIHDVQTLSNYRYLDNVKTILLFSVCPGSYAWKTYRIG